MFRYLSSGVMFLAAISSVALAAVHSLWPMFLVACLCMLCAYCAFVFED